MKDIDTVKKNAGLIDAENAQHSVMGAKKPVDTKTTHDIYVKARKK